jgi:hypothetical protein
MRLALALPCLFALGCPEYNLNENKDPVPGDSDTLPLDSEPPVDTCDSTPGEEEICDGIDNDGDGRVDEGFDDHDGDGRADCVDDDCDVGEHPGGEVPVVEECTGVDPSAVPDPWDVGIEWQWTVSAGQGVIVMPAVGNLTDDNGDGVVDENDSPDIAFSTWGENHLVALHGDGSGTIFDVPGYDGNAGVTIADVDLDGKPEVVAATVGRQVAAVDATGTRRWTSAAFSWSMYPQPAVADLDADGDVEIVMDIAVVAGLNGATIATLGGIATSWRTPVLADIDADGTQEILLGERVFSHTGALEWASTSTGWGDFAAVADVDGDVGGEVFFVTGNQMHLYEPNGRLIRSVTIPGSNPGPPAVADFDGDGQVEIALPANTSISVWEVTGTMLWSQPIQDNSGLAGCSGYDVNGDGAYEVLYADEVKFRMYDGATGALLYSNNSHSSGTLWEYPVTADVDADGSAEIVIASNSGAWLGITVFGHNGSGWAPSGPTWGTHDFAVTNLDADGSVPSPAPLSWTVHNVFRARPMVDRPGTPDLTVSLYEVCVANCEDGPVKVSASVLNQGGADVDAGALLALYATSGGIETLIDTLVLPAVPSGQVVAAGTFSLRPDQWGAEGVILSVDDDGAGNGAVFECDESNNRDSYEENVCG